MLEGQRNESSHHSQRGDLEQLKLLAQAAWFRIFGLPCLHKVQPKLICKSTYFVKHLQCGQLKATPITVMLSELIVQASWARDSMNERKKRQESSCLWALKDCWQNCYICQLVNASNSPSLPKRSKLKALTSLELISGIGLIIPGSPPYFLNLHYGSPIVRDTLRFPGSTLRCLNSLICWKVLSCSRQIFPPRCRILNFSFASDGLWSIVSPATPGVPSNRARLSPTFAVITLPPTSKQATAHDPLFSFPPPFYVNSKNFSSHFSKASFKACYGLLSRFLDLSSRTARLSLRNSAQAAPPCPSKTAQRSQFSLRGRIQGLESLRHKQRSS